MNNRLLLEHYIHFLSKHRGAKSSLYNLELIRSDKPYFNIAFPASVSSMSLVNEAFNVYVPNLPEMEGGMKGWDKTGSITYMTLVGAPAWQMNADISVRAAVTGNDIADFSMVQGKGFCDTEDEYNEWYPWLHEKNLKNLQDGDQRFYVGYYADEPVGICLAITYKDIMGIYAVATLPEYRKQGVGTTIMQQAIRGAQATGINEVTLQVMTESYAHKFYRKLGFTDAFKNWILSHK